MTVWPIAFNCTSAGAPLYASVGASGSGSGDPAGEVAHRHDAHRGSALRHDDEVPEPMGEHDVQGLSHGGVEADGHGVSRHPAIDARGSADVRVPLGESP